jgi:hypothetical protein
MMMIYLHAATPAANVLPMLMLRLVSHLLLSPPLMVMMMTMIGIKGKRIFF